MVNNSFAEIERIFHPRAVAIIGASNKEGSFGRTFVEGFIRMGFETIYPIHPRDEAILGLKAYPSVLNIPQDVDLAIILTPPASVLPLVQECTEKSVKCVVIFTAGFGEKGEQGKQAEKEIVKIARQKGTRIIGPNSLGTYCPSAKVLCFPAALLVGLPTESGTVGGFSQSGSFFDFLTLAIAPKGIRFSKMVSCGNESDLNSADFLEYLGADEETRIIVAYMEGIRDGRRFFELARRVSKKKPIIIWKAGNTPAGARAASSHTGALAGERRVWDTMFKQAGIIAVNSSAEVIDCLLAFYHLPLPKGRGVAIISGPGGAAVSASDNCVDFGLNVAKISDSSRERLAKVAPSIGGNPDNPVDLGVAALMRPQSYGESITILAEDENVDMFLIFGIPNRPCTQSIVEAAKSAGKPVVASLPALPEMMPEEYRFLSENGVPTYADVRRAASILARMAGYAEFKARE